MIEKALRPLARRFVPGRIKPILRKVFETDPPIDDPLVPPPEINFNQKEFTSRAEYVRTFKTEACLQELPFLMNRAGLRPSSCLLDYGCGLGRLAYAASNYLNESGAYYGYEPNQDALSFLKRAYRERKNFIFDGKELPRDQDYVAISKGSERVAGVDSRAVDISFVDRPVDVQYSCSVFTHMWIEPIVRVLERVGARMAKNGICVNTWFVVDDFAAYAVRCGVADRTLQHCVNGAYTHSLENPLASTAYSLDTVQQIYKSAGHEVIDILWGSWSGRDNGVIYQDIVLSRPITAP